MAKVLPWQTTQNVHTYMFKSIPRLAAFSAALLLCIVSGGCSTVQEDQSETISQSDQEKIAKFTISSLMNRPVDIMKVEHEQDLLKVSYVRPDEQTLQLFKIKFEGNRVHWGNWEGRWRDHELDEKLFYTIEDSVAYITTVFTDSQMIDTFSIK